MYLDIDVVESYSFLLFMRNKEFVRLSRLSLGIFAKNLCFTSNPEDVSLTTVLFFSKKRQYAHCHIELYAIHPSSS